VRLEGLHHSFVARVPDSQRLIVGRADDKLATRMEDDAPHPVVVPDEGEEAHPGADVPHAYHFVPGAGREERSLVRALVVRAGCRVDRRSRALRRPCDAFHHVFVFSELDLKSITNDSIFDSTRIGSENYLRLLRRHVPHAYGLVVRAAGDKLAARANPRHSHPLPVSRERLHAVARRHLPDLDGLVPGGAHHEIALRHERDGVDIVIVTVHGLYASERLMKIPQLDGHIRATGGEQLARNVKRDVLHAVGMTLQRSLEITALEVPYLTKKK